MTVPDFFIVGAAKAGTTSVADYLSQHPQLYISPVKEPHYFAKDIHQDELRPLLKKRLKDINLEAVFQSEGKEKIHRAYINDREVYERLFSFAKPGQLKGEASPSYLYSTVAANEIYRQNPSARIIIILREPVSRAFSNYLMDLRIGYATGSFEDALKEDAGSSSTSWGSRSLYRELGLYSEQVKRYFSVFPKEQICVLLYDDLQTDTPGSLRKILQFLDVSDDIRNFDLSKRNEAVIPRLSLDLQQPWVEKLKRIASNLPGGRSLSERLKKIIYKKPVQVKPDAATVKMLKEYYRKDIEQLELLTGINLSAWKQA